MVTMMMMMMMGTSFANIQLQSREVLGEPLGKPICTGGQHDRYDGLTITTTNTSFLRVEWIQWQRLHILFLAR